MRWMIIGLAALAVAGCEGRAQEPSSVGKYQLIMSMQPSGTILLNTETGKAQLLVITDNPPGGSNVATVNGQQLVWADIVDPAR